MARGGLRRGEDEGQIDRDGGQEEAEWGDMKMCF